MRQRYLEMTSIQADVYQFIRQQIDCEHCPPTVREVATRFGWKSANSAEDHIQALIRKGLLTRIPNMSRGIRVVELPVLNAPGMAVEHCV
jgi:repressor LexA